MQPSPIFFSPLAPYGGPPLSFVITLPDNFPIWLLGASSLSLDDLRFV